MKLNSSFDKVLLYVFNTCFSREFIVWVHVHVFKHFRSAGESWLLVNCADRLLNLSFSLIFIIDYINAEFKIWTSERLNQYTMMDQGVTHVGRTGARIDKDECFGVLAIFWWKDTFESLVWKQVNSLLSLFFFLSLINNWHWHYFSFSILHRPNINKPMLADYLPNYVLLLLVCISYLWFEQ